MQSARQVLLHYCTLYMITFVLCMSWESWQSLLLHFQQQVTSYLLFFFLYFSYSSYFCPYLQPCLLLVLMSHRLSNLSNPLSWLCSASWPWTAPPGGENRCSGAHSTEHTATCGIGRAHTQQWANAHSQTPRYADTGIHMQFLIRT